MEVDTGVLALILIVHRFTSVLTTLIPFLFLIGVLILVHEWGHYIVARMTGMRVEEFWVGFPFPQIHSWKRNGTVFGIGAIPIGGYVKITGMNPDDADHPEGFNRKPLASRIAVLLAGCAMNVVLATLIFAAVFSTKGVPHIRGTNEIESVTKDRPAFNAGIRPSDLIVAINGKRIKTAEQASAIIKHSNGRTLTIVARRGDKERVVHVQPVTMFLPKQSNDELVYAKQYGIGVKFGQQWEFRHTGFVDGVRGAAQHTYYTTRQLLAFLTDLLSRPKQTFESVGGPVQIMKEAGRTAQQGGAMFFMMMAGLSMNLAILNLLPIPALDGGRIMLLLFGRVHAMLFGRPLDPRKEFWLNAAGLAALLLFLLVVSAQDLGRWVGGGG